MSACVINTFNTMVDSHDKHEDDIECLKSKVADLEDCWRHNNLKIRGISESVQLFQLHHYVWDISKAVMPPLYSEDRIIDKNLMVPKPTSYHRKFLGTPYCESIFTKSKNVFYLLSTRRTNYRNLSHSRCNQNSCTPYNNVKTGHPSLRCYATTTYLTSGRIRPH